MTITINGKKFRIFGLPGIGVPKGGTDGQLLAKDGNKDYHGKWVDPPSGGDFDIKDILLAAHPVGSYYWSSEDTDPSELFGGTWEQIKDRFVLAAGDTYEAGAYGGEATVTLTTGQMPAHTHGNKSIIGKFSIRRTSSNTIDMILGISGIIKKETTNQTTPAVTRDSNIDTMQTITIDASHEHESVGNNEPIKIMPPYITAYCWKRMA